MVVVKLMLIYFWGGPGIFHENYHLMCFIIFAKFSCFVEHTTVTVFVEKIQIKPDSGTYVIISLPDVGIPNK